MPSRNNDLERLNFFYEGIFRTDINMDSFENRIRLQKLIYILISYKIHFKYNFSWYVKGPYSSDLANDGFCFMETLQTKTAEYHPTTLELKVVRKICNASKILTDSSNAELVALYLYLQPNYQDDSANELAIRKPRFSVEYINNIIKEWNELTA